MTTLTPKPDPENEVLEAAAEKTPSGGHDVRSQSTSPERATRAAPTAAAAGGEDEELPVVARMVVEIRSDGSRTIARGAIEDRLGGQAVGVEARADSPLELSRALAKMILSAPFAALLGRAKGEAASREKGVLATVGALRRRLARRSDSEDR